MDGKTGNLDQPAVSITTVAHNADSSNNDVYIPSSPINMSQSGSETYLTIGGLDRTQTMGLNLAGQVVNMDVTSTTAQPTQNWITAPNDEASITLGQFTELTYTSGGTTHTYTVWTGQEFGPIFYGY